MDLRRVSVTNFLILVLKLVIHVCPSFEPTEIRIQNKHVYITSATNHYFSPRTLRVYVLKWLILILNLGGKLYQVSKNLRKVSEETDVCQGAILNEENIEKTVRKNVFLVFWLLVVTEHHFSAKTSLWVFRPYLEVVIQTKDGVGNDWKSMLFNEKRHGHCCVMEQNC